MATTEVVLTESRTLRAAMSTRTEALDKVKALVLLPDGLHVTSRMVADYFEVEERAINKIIQRHREELETNGLVVLRGADLAKFKGDNLSLYSPGYPQPCSRAEDEGDNLSPSSPGYPQPRSSLAVFPRRAVLNVAMLLRDSEVARRVRTFLLDSEEEWRARRSEGDGRSLDAHVEEVATRAAERYCAPFGEQFAQLRGLLEAQTRVVCAMSARLVDVQEDVAELRREVGAPPRPRRRGRR